MKFPKKNNLWVCNRLNTFFSEQKWSNFLSIVSLSLWKVYTLSQYSRQNVTPADTDYITKLSPAHPPPKHYPRTRHDSLVKLSPPWEVEQEGITESCRKKRETKEHTHGIPSSNKWWYIWSKDGIRTPNFANSHPIKKKKQLVQSGRAWANHTHRITNLNK